MPVEEWEAHSGWDDVDDDEYDGSGYGADDPDDYLSEADE